MVEEETPMCLETMEDFPKSTIPQILMINLEQCSQASVREYLQRKSQQSTPSRYTIAKMEAVVTPTLCKKVFHNRF